jgi:TetR/AcrR family transcriptional regulator
MTEVNEATKAKSEQDRRARLLDAAILEFSRSGMAGARIDSIAKAAGANKQLLYHYFGDKAQLEREVIWALIERRSQEESLYPDVDGFKQTVEMDCRRRITTPLGRIWGRMLAWEALEHGAEGVIGFEERRSRFEGELLGRVREAQTSGEIDKVFDPEMLALALISIELIPAVLPNIIRMVTGFSGDEPEFAERLVTVMSQLIDRLVPEAAWESQDRHVG